MNQPAIDWTEEPYRWFFPLGILAGVVGVLLWPLWIGGILAVYPAPAHARIMLEGFFLAFIFGFLGTAGPRLIEVPSISGSAWLGIALLWTGSQLASLANWNNFAELCTIGAIVVFGTSFAVRLPRRRDLPPPGFVLVILSLILAIPAALTQMPAVQSAWSEAPALLWVGGRAFLTEGFILLPILGAAPFFFGRFGGLPPRHVCPESIRPTPAWTRQSVFVALTAVILLGCFMAKASGYIRGAAIVQSVTTLAYVATQVPFRYPRRVTILARLAQIALLAFVSAPLFEAVWPGNRFAWRHLLYIPGFQFTVVAVGTWVIFAHAGRKERLGRPWVGLVFLAICWSLAAAIRLGAEWLHEFRNLELTSAAILWIGASLAWLWMLWPSLKETD